MMRIAVSGKGGSGKTTLVGALARVFARDGRRVLAIDGDPNPNLAVALGVPPDQRAKLAALPHDLLEQRVEASGKRTHVLKHSMETITTQHGITAPDNVTLLIGAHVDHAGAG